MQGLSAGDREGRMKHQGLLGYLTEALEIQQTEGCSAERSYEIQRERAAERLRELELATAESNVIHVDFDRKR